MKNSEKHATRLAIFFTLVFILSLGIVINARAHELSKVSSYTKENQPNVYASIESYALAKWKDNKSMVIHEINEQITSMALVLLYDDMDHAVFFSAIIKWSREGKEEHNIEIFDTAETYADIRKLVVDWEMVKDEYDKKIEEKSAS